MKIITWNILTDPCKTWERRSFAFKSMIVDEKAAVLCLQEALPHQVADFESFLNGYKRLGVGRDDGGSKGEHCPIFYDTHALGCLESGTFWLSGTPEKPSKGWDLYPRICTWARFKDLKTEKELYVLNTHMPLPYNWYGKRKSFEVVVKHMREMKQVPKILTGDFNSGHTSRIWRMVYDAGFQKNPNTEKTHMPIPFLKIPLVTYDAVFTTPEWRINEYRIISSFPLRHFPSDHFGVVADVALTR